METYLKSSSILFILFATCLFSCKKESVPELTIPLIKTNAISINDIITAEGGGEIINDGGSSVIVSGLCWSSTAQTPLISDKFSGDGTFTGTFKSILKNLNPNTTYYVRAYAINGVGIGYGDVVQFTTAGTVEDYDQNIYHVVKIGSQAWMLENLRTTHYNDGTPIDLVEDNISWSGLSTAGYCWYSNDFDNAKKDNYGALYNFYALSNEDLAPVGWRVANDDDWKTLMNYLGGSEAAGVKLKESGTANWMAPNSFADNQSGFTALPAGYRVPDTGEFKNLFSDGNFWSSTLVDGIDPSFWNLIFDSPVFSTTSADRRSGFSVRCIKK